MVCNSCHQIRTCKRAIELGHEITDKRGSGIKLDDDVKAMIHEFARQLSEGEATKVDLIPRTCKICKNVKTIDVLEQLNIDKSELGEDCQSCIGSEAE